METKIGDYTIIDKHNKSLEDVKKRIRIEVLFKFINDKTIEILEWFEDERRDVLINYYPYNKHAKKIISIEDSEKFKKEFLNKNFKEFLQKKDKNVVKDFYEAKKRYESFFRNNIKDAFVHHFISFNKISFERKKPSVFSGLDYIDSLIDGKTKKNSLITHFYYKKKVKWDYIENTDLYIQLIELVNFIIKKFEVSGFNKYDFYFDIYITYTNDIGVYNVHYVPMGPKPIDSNWFYILSFYISVLLEYVIKIDYLSYNYYNRDLFNKDMDCYDIMDILIEKNQEIFL